MSNRRRSSILYSSLLYLEGRKLNNVFPLFSKQLYINSCYSCDSLELHVQMHELEVVVDSADLKKLELISIV